MQNTSWEKQQEENLGSKDSLHFLKGNGKAPFGKRVWQEKKSWGKGHWIFPLLVHFLLTFLFNLFFPFPFQFLFPFPFSFFFFFSRLHLLQIQKQMTCSLIKYSGFSLDIFSRKKGNPEKGQSEKGQNEYPFWKVAPATPCVWVLGQHKIFGICTLLRSHWVHTLDKWVQCHMPKDSWFSILVISKES